jgi:hypothetical protein
MIEIPDQQHWQAAVGYVEFGMFLEAGTSQSAFIMQIVRPCESTAETQPQLQLKESPRKFHIMMACGLRI